MSSTANPVQPPKVVVFDLGKVLVDFDYSIACRRFAEKSSVTADNVRDLLNQTSLLFDFETGKLSNEQFYQAMKDATGFTGNFDQFRDIFQDIFAPMPEMIALHAALRSQGTPTYIFSNTNEIAISFIRAQYPFFAHFDAHVLSYEHGAMKPQPKLYEVVERVTGCRGAKILYIDDRSENIEAGARRGWQVILQETPDRTRQQVRARGFTV